MNGECQGANPAGALRVKAVSFQLPGRGLTQTIMELKATWATKHACLCFPHQCFAAHIFTCVVLCVKKLITFYVCTQFSHTLSDTKYAHTHTAKSFNQFPPYQLGPHLEI